MKTGGKEGRNGGLRTGGQVSSVQMQHLGSGPCKCVHLYSCHFLSVLESWKEVGVFILICLVKASFGRFLWGIGI